MSTNGHRPTIALVAHGVHDDGGMERAFSELIRRASSDFRFVVLASKLDPGLEHLVEFHRIRVPRRPIPLKLVLFAVFAALTLRRTKADLVHSLGAIVPNKLDLVTAQFCCVGFHARTGHLAPVEAPVLRRVNTSIDRLLSIALERWCYRPTRTRALGAVSPGLATELERHFRSMPVTITPNGVDAARFRPNLEARRRVRAQEGVGDADLVLLFVGGDWERKGLGIAIGALARCRIERAQLWVVGRGDEQRFAAHARDAGVGDAVRFFGMRSDAERYYAAADLFVFPTAYETFSLVAYEAAAAGLPVVAPPVSGIEELLGDGTCGIAVERTADSVATAVTRLWNDRELRVAMGKAGRAKASTFTWDEAVGNIVRLYRRLAEEAA